MSISKKLYCKIYIDAPLEAKKLIAVIKSQKGEIFPWNSLRTKFMELEAHQNQDFISIFQRRHKNDFIHYQLYLEIDPIDENHREEYVDEIKELLYFLWSLGYPSVASCDFENELPKNKLGSYYRPKNIED